MEKANLARHSQHYCPSFQYDLTEHPAYFSIIHFNHVKFQINVSIASCPCCSMLQVASKLVCFRKSQLPCYLNTKLIQTFNQAQINVVESKLAFANDAIFHTFVIKSQGPEQLTKDKLIAVFSPTESNSLQPLSQLDSKGIAVSIVHTQRNTNF